MGTQPDNPSPFVQGSIPIDLNDIGSEQRLCDFYLRLRCKIRRIVNRFHWCPPLKYFPPLSSLQFRLWYNGFKKKGSCTSQRWHFNSCWADKENTPPNINSALWTHPRIMLFVCVGDVKTETGGEKENDSKWWCHVCSVCKRASKNTRSENETHDEKHVRIKQLLKWGGNKNYTPNLLSSSSVSFVYF